jgi:arginine exporter protein ArgO
MINFLLGALAASVVWFFIWRNNKKQFVSALETIDRTKLPAELVTQFASIFGKYLKK